MHSETLGFWFLNVLELNGTVPLIAKYCGTNDFEKIWHVNSVTLSGKNKKELIIETY